ncbi:MAG TPA: hypothetical protein DCM87_05035 [Planctomycetes bacterium]|nr:hypothetical protein [Planctomycetota bacterium]
MRLTPPSAGSASGVLPNPVGYNRVYVHVDGELTYAKWWEGLQAGRAFVTNGPLLRVRTRSPSATCAARAASAASAAREAAGSSCGRSRRSAARSASPRRRRTTSRSGMCRPRSAGSRRSSSLTG